MERSVNMREKWKKRDRFEKKLRELKRLRRRRRKRGKKDVKGVKRGRDGMRVSVWRVWGVRGMRRKVGVRIEKIYFGVVEKMLLIEMIGVKVSGKWRERKNLGRNGMSV